MADFESITKDFESVIEALENGEFGEAFEKTKSKVKELVNIEDNRDGDVEERLQYKYRRFKRKGLTLLHYAALYSQVKMVKLLLENGADPLKKEIGKAGNNPFLYACIFGGKEVIQLFLSFENYCGELVNRGNNFSWIPLFYVSERKDPELIKLLLNKGADPNGKTDATLVAECSVLQFATKYSSPECVAELLNYEGETRVDVNFQEGKLHQTAMHMACEDDKLQIVELLYENEADATLIDCKNRTALQIAMCNGAERCAEFLVGKLTVKKGLMLLKEATDKPKIVLNILRRHEKVCGRYCINFADNDYEDKIVLHKIVESEAYSDEEFTDVVKLLGKNCIEQPDQNGRTPIMVAAMLNRHRKMEILVDIYTRILTDCLFTPDKGYYDYLYENLMAKRDNYGNSSIHLAVVCDGPESDFEETVKVLSSLRKNERVGKHREMNPLLVQTEVTKQTAMHLAIEKRKPERALLLLKETGGDGVEMKDDKSFNVIHCAIHHKIRAFLFQQLLNLSKKSKDIKQVLKAKNESGETPLQMALQSDLSLHAEHMLSMNDCNVPGDEIDGDEGALVDPNEVNEQGKNALRIAIEKGAPIDLVTKLLDGGCDPTRPDKDEKMPVHVDENTNIGHFKAVLRHESITLEGGLGRTLLRGAIKAKRSDLIKLLSIEADVDSSILADVIVKSENEDFAMLLVRYTKDARDLMKQLRVKVKGQGSESEVMLFHALIEKMPDVAEEALYRSVMIGENGSIDYSNTQILLDEMDDSEEAGIEMQEFSNHSRSHSREDIPNLNSSFNCMVENKELKLLQHPGVNHILNMKWNKFGLPLYFVQLIAYCFFIIPLSILVLLPIISSEFTNSYDFEAYSLAVVVLIISILHLLVLVSVLCRKHCDHKLCLPIIKTFYHYLQVIVFIMSIAFSILTIMNTATKGCCGKPTWHIGLFAIILAWTYLIHLSSKLPFVGEQAIMFLDIASTFLKLTMFALLLVLAATIVLAMTFYDANAPHSPFLTFGRGIVTVMTMITGELDYMDVFGLSYDVDAVNDTDDINTTIAEEIRNIPYPESAQLVWVIFLIIIPILLSNMLTGLAVGDVIEIQKNAALRKLEHQVNSVESAEYYIHGRKQSKGKLYKGRCFRITSCISSCFSVLYELMKMICCGEKSSKQKKVVKEMLLSYDKKRTADIEDIKEGGEFHKDTRIMESIDDMKEIALSCDKRIKEFKDVYDGTIKKLREDNAKLKTELQKLSG